MAEETDLSRTEPASPRRLQQARRAGDVPRSRELGAWIVLIAALGALGWLAPSLFSQLSQTLQAGLQVSAHDLPAEPFSALWSVALALLPLLGLILLAALLAPMLLSGWVFAPQALRFDTQRLRPLSALRQLFSTDGMFALGKSALKLAAVAAVCWLTLTTQFSTVLPGRIPGPLPNAIGALLLHALLTLAAVLALFAFADAAWAWWRYRARHAMSWQEMLAEARESEVSPEVRARVRQRQQAAGQAASPGHAGSLIDEAIE